MILADSSITVSTTETTDREACSTYAEQAIAAEAASWHGGPTNLSTVD
jgi:hypothetical protein